MQSTMADLYSIGLFTGYALSRTILFWFPLPLPLRW